MHNLFASAWPVFHDVDRVRQGLEPGTLEGWGASSSVSLAAPLAAGVSLEAPAIAGGYGAYALFLYVGSHDYLCRSLEDDQAMG